MKKILSKLCHLLGRTYDETPDADEIDVFDTADEMRMENSFTPESLESGSTKPAEILGYEADARRLLSPPTEELDEVRVPRISRVIFDRYIAAIQPEDYLYRLDVVDSPKVGRVGLSDLPTQGHRYINPCRNITRAEKYYLGRDLQLLSSIKETVRPYVEGNAGGGLYCFLSLRDAVAEQHVQAQLAQGGSTLAGYRELVAVLTRYRKNVSFGTLLPDPLTMGRATAALQITKYVGGKIASIDPELIEIWFDGRWHCLSSFHMDDLLRDVDSGNLERIMFPCEGVDPAYSACWHEAGHIVMAILFGVLGEFSFVGKKNGDNFGITNVQLKSDDSEKERKLQCISLAGYASTLILYKKGRLVMTEKEFIDFSMKAADDDRRAFHSALGRFADAYSPEADEYFMTAAMGRVVPILNEHWPRVASVARALRLTEPNWAETSSIVPDKIDFTGIDTSTLRVLTRAELEKLGVAVSDTNLT